MADKRRDDTGDRSWFRTERLVQEGGKWYFLTREGTVEGPFDTRIHALERLDAYTRVMSMDLISAESEAQFRSG